MNIDDVKRVVRGMFEPEIDELESAVLALEKDLRLYISHEPSKPVYVHMIEIKLIISKLRSKLPTIQED